MNKSKQKNQQKDEQQVENTKNLEGQRQTKPQYLNYDALNSERDKCQEVEFDNFDDQQVFDWNLQDCRQLLNRPTIREGSSLTYYKDKLYLYGGFSEKLKDDLFEYDIKKNSWRQVKFDLKQLSIPIESRMGHTANLYGNQLIIFGGEGQYNERIKSRNNFNDILLLDLENFSWSKLHTSVHIIEHRRNHASTIFGNNLFIIGGVNNSEEYLNNVQAVNLENGRVKNYEIPQFKKGIAFHTAMACYKKIFNPAGKKKQHQVKEEGIYIFGGKNQRGKCYNDLYVAKLDEKQKIFEWKMIDIQDQKPEPRFGHTMNYLSSSNSLIIYGGKDNDGNFYKDFWVFRLYYQKWIKLDVQGEIERNRHLHCSAINDTNIMYVFGGIDSHKLVSWNLYKVNFQNPLQ
ncbi:Galactose oxidase/kelch, beta-propeller [Pseudocohnilembus persalinus]|uniref:Galactose oxidase/kelch, beta-propeller n=1 Tax=Pseudocohnilembus persalinus TaxID=266149 RepID=A0A0V0R1G6_PSEPJ|nr:Galactose oxidase/kelch, beta-propeller [Pseudocohnilembus persalinus]|eukprot:KRX08367.1 Galactose oxidase/kelch, beta-propeller [Pseudocohnilembus persalinus]